MKSRLICLAMCLLMGVSAFLTGCSSKTNEEAESTITDIASETALSLTMWVVSEKEVSPETADRVNNAINDITKSKFKTKLTVYFLTEDVYRSTLSETIRAREDSKSQFITGATEAETEAVTESGEIVTVVDETETNKYGQTVIKYPDLKPNQVDIIYIDGEDMFREYVANGWLKTLDEELSASSKKIKEYVSQTLLTAAKIEGGTYAIPNNNTIGEYTFMLLNKELMEASNFSGTYEKGEIDGFFNDNIYAYLDIIRKQNDPNVVPIDATYEECLDLLAHYWSIDPKTYEVESDRFSLLGYRYTDPKTLSRGTTALSFNSLFADETFRKNYYELNAFRLDGQYFGEATEGKTAAVTFATGGLADYQKYCSDDSEYYPVIVKYPSVDVEDVFNRMFGVCAFTDDLSRCMQILTYLTTNPDFRNLLQYGVEDVDYKKVTDGEGNVTVERLTDDYVMDVFKTGNAFIAYPNPAQNLSADVWEIGKQQNREALIEPLLNFNFADLAQNSGTSSSTTPKLDAKGYTYTATSGYSREILSQNALLKEWMDAADAAGKGVYVLHTSTTSGQNLTGRIYYYNNNVTSQSVEVTDQDGAVNVRYQGSAGNGYALTVINFYGKKNSSKLNWTYTVGGTTANAVVKYRNALVDFDFLDTETYQITLSTDLTLAKVADNEAVLTWVKDSEKTGETPYLGTFVTEADSNGRKTYTYLVYVPTIANPYSVTVQPTGGTKTLDLRVAYQTDASGKLGSTKYALFLVKVSADADVTVNWNFQVNGNANPTVTNVPFESDPDFTVCGELDVELVKYFSTLSERVEQLVASCTTAEQLKNVIEDLGILLTPQSNSQVFDTDADALKAKLSTAEVQALVDDLDLEQLYWNLLSATSSASVTHKVLNDEDKLVDATTNEATGEAYYYFKSPYMLYYTWMKSNGYTK